MLITGILIIFVLGALFIVYSTFWVKYSSIQLGDQAKKNFTVVQISDLHGQTHFINGALSKMVNNVKPDLVMITGDLASTKGKLDKVLMEIRRIECSYLFFVPGNHERYSDQDYDEIIRTIQESNIAVLSNQGCPIDMGEKKWLVYGFDNWMTSGRRLNTFKIMKELKVMILSLCSAAHSPSIIKSALDNQIPYDLLLVGHTHGGQISLLGHTIGAYKDYHVGLKQLDKRKHFYIHRGLGTSRIPIRVAFRPEIAVFKIGL